MRRSRVDRIGAFVKSIVIHISREYTNTPSKVLPIIATAKVVAQIFVFVWDMVSSYSFVFFVTFSLFGLVSIFTLVFVLQFYSYIYHLTLVMQNTLETRELPIDHRYDIVGSLAVRYADVAHHSRSSQRPIRVSGTIPSAFVLSYHVISWLRVWTNSLFRESEGSNSDEYNNSPCSNCVFVFFQEFELVSRNTAKYHPRTHVQLSHKIVIAFRIPFCSSISTVIPEAPRTHSKSLLKKTFWL